MTPATEESGRSVEDGQPDRGTRLSGIPSGPAESGTGGADQLRRPPGARTGFHLVTVDARPAGRLLRGDAGGGRGRTARSPDVARRDRTDRREGGATHLAIGSGRDAPDPREARLEHFPTSTSRTSRPSPRPTGPPTGPTRSPLAPTGRGRPVRDHLHERDDGRAEGRDAQPREHRGHDRDGPQRDPAAGAPARLAPAVVAPHGAGDRPVLRPDGRRRHPVRPEPQSPG